MRSSRSIKVAGVTRRYLLAEPQGTPTGLVLSLHGSRGSADRQARLTGLDGLAESAVVAFPEAALRLGAGYQWDLYSPSTVGLIGSTPMRAAAPVAGSRASPTPCVPGEKQTGTQARQPSKRSAARLPAPPTVTRVGWAR